MLRSEIITNVKALLEEFSPFEEREMLVAIPTSDVKPIDAYIDEVLDASYDSVLLYAPLHLIKHNIIDATTNVNTDIDIQDGVGYFDVPCDFLRLHSCIFGDWQRIINDVITPVHPNYILQRNPYTRGKKVKPVVAINNNKFEFYSVSEDYNCSVFKYIPVTPEQNDEFEDTLRDVLAYEAAIKVCKIFERNDKATMLEKELQKKITVLNR